MNMYFHSQWQVFDLSLFETMTGWLISKSSLQANVRFVFPLCSLFWFELAWITSKGSSDWNLLSAASTLLRQKQWIAKRVTINQNLTLGFLFGGDFRLKVGQWVIQVKPFSSEMKELLLKILGLRTVCGFENAKISFVTVLSRSGRV